MVRYSISGTDIQDDTTGTDDTILEAEGRVIPTGDSGFRVGAHFRKLNAEGEQVVYLNTGTESVAVWSKIGWQVVSASIITFPVGTGLLKFFTI